MDGGEGGDVAAQVGGRLGYTYLTRQVAAADDTAGATMAARQGATTRELMHRLGHASPAMALRYQRAEQERDAILAAAMSAALRQS